MTQEASTRQLLTVKQFSRAYPAWTEAALRALIYGGRDRIASDGRVIPGNQLHELGAVVKCGRRVLLDPQRFLGPWLAAQQRKC
jgi:hypothetical protein